MSWIIMGHRGPGSMFGQADRPVKRGGEILVFETEAAALSHCRQLNVALRTPNVYYSVEEQK